MRRPLFVAGSLSLALHALLFLALPPPRGAEPRPPSPSLSLRLSRMAASPAALPAALPKPAGPADSATESSRAANPIAPPLLEAAEAQAPAEPRPPEAEGALAEPETRGTELDPGPAASEAVEGEKSALAGQVEAGSAGPGEPSPAELLMARLEAHIEAQKAYPEAARRRGSEGVVRIAVIVAPDGKLRSIRRAASSGSSLLDQAALELLRGAFPLESGAGRELEIVLAIRYQLKP